MGASRGDDESERPAQARPEAGSGVGGRDGTCPFCTLFASRIVAADALALVIRDGYPVSPGHTLVVPRRHIASIAHATRDEADAIWSLLADARRALDAELAPAGYNIGINDGVAAGQTVMHLHVHLIPRFHGDRADPRGGVRWVIPEKADYWSARDAANVRADGDG
jgi:diadenosine tetraphosphate (Ap4A) HIT family hydrolase